ncbi:MAG: hypothetical protein ACHQVS_00590 [Candidatus Babeliales bacterium]
MNQQLMIDIEHVKNGRTYRMQIPMMQQPWSEAHEAALDFAKQIVEMESLAKNQAEQASKPVEVVIPEVVESAG